VEDSEKLVQASRAGRSLTPFFEAIAPMDSVRWVNTNTSKRDEKRVRQDLTIRRATSLIRRGSVASMAGMVPKRNSVRSILGDNNTAPGATAGGAVVGASRGGQKRAVTRKASVNRGMGGMTMGAVSRDSFDSDGEGEFSGQHNLPLKAWLAMRFEHIERRGLCCYCLLLQHCLLQ
jgi:hypothetical protein